MKKYKIALLLGSLAVNILAMATHNTDLLVASIAGFAAYYVWKYL